MPSQTLEQFNPALASVSSTILISRISLVKLSMKQHWPTSSTGSMTRARPDGSKPLHAESA